MCFRMSYILRIVGLVVSVGLVTGAAATGSNELFDLKPDTTTTLREQPVQVPEVLISGFEVIVDQDCTTGAMRFVVLDKNGYAAYKPIVSGDTVFIRLLGYGLAITPSRVNVTEDKNHPARKYPLAIMLENDTAWYSLVYNPDSIVVEEIKGGDYVKVRSASRLPEGTLSEYVTFSRYTGPSDVWRKIQKINERLKGIGSCVALPAGYYRCLPDRIETMQLARRQMINMLGKSKVVFVKLQQTDDQSRTLALQVIREASEQ
jgi:hypothetical protein